MRPIPRTAFGTVLCALLLLLSLIALVGLSERAHAFSAISAEFSSPSYAGTSEIVPCTLVLSGGPAGDLGGTFSYELEIEADNSTGSKIDVPKSSSSTGVFRMNLTMPGESGQTITVIINATSTDSSDKNKSNEFFEFKIKIVQPIIISAEIFNTGTADAKNVTAEFYADGVLLDTQTFNISAGESEVLTYNWTFSSIKDGKHKLMVVVDDDADIVEFSDGNNVFTQVIYIGEQSNLLGAFLTLAVIFLAIIVFLTYLQKPTRKKT